MLFAWWLRRQVPVADLAPGEPEKIDAAVRAFAAAWIVFVLLFNVAVGVFLWLRRASRPGHSSSSLR
jgi:hypothetical protein